MSNPLCTPHFRQLCRKSQPALFWKGSKNWFETKMVFSEFEEKVCKLKNRLQMIFCNGDLRKRHYGPFIGFWISVEKRQQSTTVQSTGPGAILVRCRSLFCNFFVQVILCALISSPKQTNNSTYLWQSELDQCIQKPLQLFQTGRDLIKRIRGLQNPWKGRERGSKGMLPTISDSCRNCRNFGKFRGIRKLLSMTSLKQMFHERMLRSHLSLCLKKPTYLNMMPGGTMVVSTLMFAEFPTSPSYG